MLALQVAEEIWICDHKSVTKYDGDIMNFKLMMRKEIKKSGAGGKPAAMTQHING